jgi:peptidyl-prolyl cis-trans isomerase D
MKSLNFLVKVASDKLLVALARKTPLADALKALGASLPPPQPVTMSRQQLSAMQPKVPATLSLMFAMAQGTVKRLEAPAKGGFVIVSLSKIMPGEVTPDDPILTRARLQLGQVTGREYVDQLRAAVREAVGVKRNEAAITTLRNQLLGGQ